MVAVVASAADYQCQKWTWEAWSDDDDDAPEVMAVAEAGAWEAPKEVMVAMEEEVAVVSFSAVDSHADAFRPWDPWNVCYSDVTFETFAVACSLSSCCP